MKTIKPLTILLCLLIVFGCKKEEEVQLPVTPYDNPDGICGNCTPTLEDNHFKQNVGASANELLAANQFENLIVEISYDESRTISQRTVDELRTFLENRLNKTSIDIQTKPIPKQSASSFSISEIKDLEETHRTLKTDEKTITAHLIVLNGYYDKGETVLGVAYRNTSMALFAKAIDNYSGGLGEPSTSLLESSVTLHEFGHILGLVNVGTDMQTEHQDEENGSHCDNDKCLMYWAAESGDAVGSLLGTGNVPSLDQNCLNDLKANGGK